MKIERKWIESKITRPNEPWVWISEDRASRELANAHGDDAIEELKERGTLTTRWGEYRVTEG